MSGRGSGGIGVRMSALRTGVGGVSPLGARRVRYDTLAVAVGDQRDVLDILGRCILRALVGRTHRIGCGTHHGACRLYLHGSLYGAVGYVVYMGDVVGASQMDDACAPVGGPLVRGGIGMAQGGDHNLLRRGLGRRTVCPVVFTADGTLPVADVTGGGAGLRHGIVMHEGVVLRDHRLLLGDLVVRLRVQEQRITH